MMDSLSLSRVTSNDDETDMLIPRRNFHTKKKEEKKIIQPNMNGVSPTWKSNYVPAIDYLCISHYI